MKNSAKKKKASKSSKLNPVYYIVGIAALILVAAGFIYLNSDDKQTTSPSDGDHGKSEYGQVSFYTLEGEKIIDLLVEVAEDEIEQVMGLMFREDLSESLGMIFLYDDEDIRHFWMKNTPTSLDMIFVNSEMEIVHIEKYTKPMSQTLYPSKYPAQYVVETVAGYTDQYDIRVGSKIKWNPPENSS